MTPVLTRDTGHAGLASLPTAPFALRLHMSRPCVHCQASQRVSCALTSSLQTRMSGKMMQGRRVPGLGLSSARQPRRIKRKIVTAASSDDVPLADRLAASIVYLVPLMDGIRYGRFFFTQFPATLSLLSPIFPLFRAYTGFPLASLIVFFAIYGGIINNMQFSRFVRYNAMQAILLSIVLILASVLLSLYPKGTLSSGVGLNIFVSLNNTVWLYIAICFAYAVGSCLIGQVARLPLVSSAADQRVP